MPDYLEAVATDPWPSTAMAMYANAGELAGICGIRALGSGIGSVWMVGTDVLDRHPIEFLRDSKAWLATQKSGWRVLANCVDARNAGHMAWLRWLGFEIEERTIPFGAEQRPFHPFRLNSSQREPCASQPFPPLARP